MPKRRDQQGAGALVAVAQILGGPRCELDHGLDQWVPNVDRVAEAAPAGDLLLGRWRLPQADAAYALHMREVE